MNSDLKLDKIKCIELDVDIINIIYWYSIWLWIQLLFLSPSVLSYLQVSYSFSNNCNTVLVYRKDAFVVVECIEWCVHL